MSAPQSLPALEGPALEAEDLVCDYRLEMLSLSQDQQNPSCIQFDDSNWQLHLTSLKPLGLNVLLNLCSAGVTERLCRFSDHLCNIALQESHRAVRPVQVPWGLCELARLIGQCLRPCLDPYRPYLQLPSCCFLPSGIHSSTHCLCSAPLHPLLPPG